MTTINISLPDKLKDAADALIKDGYYASFSDLVRTSLRQILLERRLDRLAKQAKEDYKNGKGTLIRTNKDLKKFMDQF
jgi:Arc/MetJ-type ribon-helix-helix transcriptional regulator